MPEKIGLIAEFQDKQFREGAKRYIKAQDDLEAATKDMSKAVEKSSKSIDDLGGDMEEGGLAALNLAAQMAIVSQAMGVVKDLAGKGLELAKLGATAERIEERFAAFAEEVGGAEAMLEAFQEGAGGAASKMEAMQSASQLIQMDLVNTTAEMEELVTIAVRLGDQTQTVTQRTENFALMMANQSLPRLDSYGISSGVVRNRIQELQAATEGLTREEAFSIAVREEAGKSLEILGERTVDTAMTFEIMEARMADAKVELGKGLAPIFGTAMDALGGLGDEAFMAAAAFGEFGGALVQAGPLLNAMMPMLGKMPGALKAMSLGLKSSALALGALGVALIALGIAIDKYSKAMAGMREEEQKAKQAAAESKNVILEQVDAGQRLGDVMLAQADKTNVATKAWNDNIVTGTAVSVLVGAQNKILEIYDKKNRAVTEGVLASTTSYEGYIEAILIYNDNLTDAAARVDILTAAEYDIAQAAYDATIATEDLGQATEDLGYAVEDAGMGAEDSESRFRHLTRAMQDGTIVTDEDAAAQARLVYELGLQEEALIDSKAAAEESARKHEELARAHDLAKEAAFNHAEGLLALAERLSNAEDSEILFRASLEKLGQMQDDKKISAEQYLRMYEQLQSQFGFTTEKGTFLKRGIELLGDMLAQDKIKPQDYGDAVEHLWQMAEKGETKISAFKDEMAKYEAPAEAAARRTEEMTQAIENQETPIGRGFAAMDRLRGVYTDSEEPILDSTEAVDEFTGKATDADQPTKDLTDKVDNLTTAGGETVGPLGDMTEAVGDFTQSVLDAQDPVDELLARFELLPDQILTLAPQMRQAGVSLVGAFRVGFEGAFDALEEEKVKRLRIFREEFHASREPKDPTSPLRGFFGAGAALVQTYIEGLESEWPNLGKTLDDMFSFGRAFGGLGGIAAGMLNKDVRALKDATKDIDAQMLEIYKSLGGKGRPGGGQELYDAIIELRKRRSFPDLAPDYGPPHSDPRTRAFESLIPLMEARRELTEEQVRLEEKLLRMEEQQTRLRFLEQQVALLELITKHGLMGKDILDGMKFGADASAEEVLEAMTRAMEEVIKQAEERLGIQSPSAVFHKIGQQTMMGMAGGIQEMAALPVRESAIASRAVASAPAMMSGGNIDNSRTITIQAGRNTINNAMEGAMFEERVRRAVTNGIRGYR